MSGLHSLSGQAICARLTSYLRDCIPGHGPIAYKERVNVPNIEPKVSGTSIRRGAINEMKAQGCTHENVSFRSGHDLTTIGAQFEYYDLEEWDSLPGKYCLFTFTFLIYKVLKPLTQFAF